MRVAGRHAASWAASHRQALENTGYYGLGSDNKSQQRDRSGALKEKEKESASGHGHAVQPLAHCPRPAPCDDVRLPTRRVATSQPLPLCSPASYYSVVAEAGQSSSSLLYNPIKSYPPAFRISNCRISII